MHKVSLFLMGEKGYRVLQHLDRNYKGSIAFVVGARDSGVRDDYYEKIQKLCRERNIAHYHRKAGNIPAETKVRYALAIGWKWMLETDIPLIVIHDSLLPKYRGFAPLVNCLINGEEVIGATALFGSNKFDTGNIIVQVSKYISYPIKIGQAIEKMSGLYLEITDFLFTRIEAGLDLMSYAQNHAEATYSLWRDESDYWINWNHTSAEICRFIDAVGPPYLGAMCLIDGERAFVLDAQPVEDCPIMDRRTAIGKVLFVENDGPIIVCGKGMVKLTKIINGAGDSVLPLKKFRTRFTEKC